MSLFRLFYYKFSLRFGFNPVLKIDSQIIQGRFFSLIKKKRDDSLEINSSWINQKALFSWFFEKNKSLIPPDWHKNALTSVVAKNRNEDWWKISDFDPSVGDIKVIWESSRFSWVVTFAQQASLGDDKSLDTMNRWLLDWVENNQAYKGVNWKCAQECSIRVMNLAMALLILNQAAKPEASLLSLIEVHLQRIAPTISYAIAQNNNHGTSEASALYIGGSLLAMNGVKEGKIWQCLGLKWLEDRASCLIEDDGTFSQYSITYHRMMLDTYSMVEIWRRHFNLTQFSKNFSLSLSNASNWLFQFTQIETGDAPNLGANDGAHLLVLSNTNYRDFRPSVQLATALFSNKRAYDGDGDWNQPLQWLGVSLPEQQVSRKKSVEFSQGGYSLLYKKNSFALLNHPSFRFRPSQCDVLHLDFWVDGVNLLRDAGTYSYNSSNKDLCYFGGTKGHNTIQFDEREQMPRLSRFLLGDWLKSTVVKSAQTVGNVEVCSAKYVDSKGASHQRDVILDETSLKVTDHVSGFKSKAVLRWRLKKGNWKLNNNTLINGKHRLTVSSTTVISRMELIEGEESLYYFKKETIPVFEIEIKQAGIITSEYKIL